MKASPTHIIHVTSYYPPHVGGMENCVQAISEKQAQNGHTVIVYTSTSGLFGKKLKAKANHKVLYLTSIELAHTPILFSLFFRLLTIPKKSILHVHISQAFTPEIVFLIAAIKRIPYVAHIHLDVDPSGRLGFLLEPYKRIFLKHVLQHASEIICLSQAQKYAIAKKYSIPNDRISIVPNGVAASFFQQARTHIHHIPNILFVGRFTSQKNLLLLIRAIALMKQKAHVTFVGDGEQKRDMETLINDLNLSNISLVGRKNGDEIRTYYKMADIFILPSKKEGVSLAMLEAMASGLAIVASDIPSLREFLNGIAVLIEPTEGAFAKVLDSIIARPDFLKKLSKLSIENAKKYTWDSTVAKIEDVYRKVSV